MWMSSCLTNFKVLVLGNGRSAATVLSGILDYQAIFFAQHVSNNKKKKTK